MKKIIFFILTTFPLILFGQSHSWDGQEISPNSKFRVLNICINVIYDVHLQSDPVGDGNSHWARAYNEGVNNEAIPDNLLDFMDTVYNPNHLQGFITRSFGESSFDSLQLIGDFVIVNVKESSVLALSGRDTIPTNSNPDALDRASFSLINIKKIARALINTDSLVTVFGRNHIEDYDFLGNNTIYFAHIIFRNITSGYGGLNGGSGLGGDPDFESIKIRGHYYPLARKGVQVGSMGAGIVSHEISHSLFGSDSFHTSGGNHRYRNDRIFMPFFTLQGGFGLMGAANKGLVSCNGYERWRMHWKHTAAPFYISARNIANTSFLNSDISKEQGNCSFLLQDFVTHGDAIRIKMPYKDSDAASNQYIWLENHQVGFNDKLDYLQWSDETDCRPQGNSGIYAYYQVGRDILSGTPMQVWESDERDNLKIIPAEGYWDYNYYEDTTNRYNLECVNWSEHADWMSRETSNPFGGFQDQETFFFPNNTNDDTLKLIHEKVLWRKKIGTQNIDNLPFFGDNQDAFSSQTKIGLGTNPSTCNTRTYYNYITELNVRDFTSQIHRNNQTTYLTGLSIEMIPQSNHNMRVNIRWDDYDIVNDARWSGRICNKEQVNLTSGNTIELVQNHTVAQPYRDAETGLFAKTTLLYCDSGSHFVQQPHSTVIVSEKSKLQLKKGSDYWVQDSALLWVKSGGKLDLEKGALLKIFGTFIIDSMAVVTIKDTIQFSQNAVMIIKPGGKLIVDGGCLTNAVAGEMWRGIYVKGNPNLPQTGLNQGRLELKNGAVVANARYAICTTEEWFTPNANSKTGGIVNASNTIFKNNLVSAIFYPYSNINNNNVYDNVSFFNNCTFELNDTNYFSSITETFQGHVLLWGVRSVKFNGCHFKNQTTIPGRAIYSENAGFLVDYYCLPSSPISSSCNYCTDHVRSRFSGFTKAIEVLTTGTQYNVSVSRSDFYSNNSAISITGNHYAKIVQSTMNVTPFKNGITLKNASGYHIEENRIYNTAASTGSSSTSARFIPGLDINNSGQADNLIYRNTFEQLQVAVYAQYTNGGMSSLTTYSGLEFQCDSFVNNINDILVSSNGIIKVKQGSNTSGADNLFINTQYSSIENQGNADIYYHYSSGAHKSPYNPLGLVSAIGTAAPNSCATTLCSGGQQGSQEELLDYYLSLQSEYDAHLAQFINNGYHEIIAAYSSGNTDIPYNHPAFAALDNLISIGNEMSKLSNSTIHALLSDSILYMDNLKAWYSVIRTPVAKYALVEAHVQTSNYEAAEAVMNQIPEMFNFEENAMIEHNNYQDFYYSQKEIFTSNRNWAQLTDEEIDNLKNIALATSGRSAAMAQGVLCFFYNICLEEEAEKMEKKGATENGTWGTEHGEWDTENGAGVAVIAVFPNPTTEEVTIVSYHSSPVISYVEVYNMLGIRVQVETINAQEGKIKLAGTPGIYMMRIVMENGEVVLKKMVKK